MTILDLKFLLSKERIPKNLTEEQFNRLPVLIQTGDDSFDIPDEVSSGYVIFTNSEEVDENNLAEDDVPAFVITLLPIEKPFETSLNIK